MLFVSIAVVTYVFRQIQRYLLVKSTKQSISNNQDRNNDQITHRIKITNPYMYVFGNVLSQGKSIDCCQDSHSRNHSFQLTNRRQFYGQSIANSFDRRLLEFGRFYLRPGLQFDIDHLRFGPDQQPFGPIFPRTVTKRRFEYLTEKGRLV